MVRLIAVAVASATVVVLRTGGRVLYATTYGRAVWRLALGPGARIVGPDTLAEGQTGVYDARQSKAFGGATLTYLWTLPDGSQATTPTVSYTPTSVGSKTLTLAVTAPDGRTATTTTAVGGSPASVATGRPSTCTATVTGGQPRDGNGQLQEQGDRRGQPGEWRAHADRRQPGPLLGDLHADGTGHRYAQGVRQLLGRRRQRGERRRHDDRGDVRGDGT
jgi:hypothetical protein